jgi:hypothetical protein
MVNIIKIEDENDADTEKKLKDYLVENNNIWDSERVNINEIIKSSFSSLKNQSSLDFLSGKNLRIVNKTQNNLISLFVHNLRLPFISKNCFRKCNNVNCNTCLFAYTNHFISLNNNYFN